MPDRRERGMRRYRLLLSLFPAAFRQRWGSDMETVCRHRLDNTGDGLFGVRLALGATPRAVVGSALRNGVAPVIVGAISGIALGLAGGRLLRSYLYQVEPFDPLTLLTVSATLALVATAALVVPAWNAGRVDPSEVLSAE